MSEGLRPCPFCGGKAEINRHTDKAGDVLVRVKCHDAWCLGHNYHWYSERDVTDAIDAWNQRAERTCKMENGGKVPNWILESVTTWFCSDCGSPIYNDMGPDYCLYCGAKVVE